jgi:sulfur-oxidizing protein SoxY
MSLTRRHAIRASAGALLGFAVPAAAQQHLRDPSAITAEEAEADFVQVAVVQDGGVTLTLPEVAEDGFRVLVEIEAHGAEEIMLIAPGNPIPPIFNAVFGPVSASYRVTSRIRLGQTQTVVALARMPDGSVRRTTRFVEVLVGGCG